ncbi:MAG: pilus assembly protein TadD [Bacteroidetes bacterium]|nr:pilus assembly protein TadD [Bacteroidota bacterium]
MTKSFFRNIFISLPFFLIIASLFKCSSSKNNEFQKETYKNLDSNVHYVGMLVCKECHSNIYETFIETGMGKSFDRATKTKTSAHFGNNDVVHDKFSDLNYHPFWSGDSMNIMEFRLEKKDTTFKRIETVNYIVGSGQHTNSHIFNTNGYLHQMPMTFYTQKGKWDLPPGFENGENERFSRKIGLECMSCHNSLPEFVLGSENRYSNIPNGIGCERCHGPGEIHVKEMQAGMTVNVSKQIDYSIVNPAKLPIDLQFDVCQRCHLQGNAVLKSGKSFFDFRPGMKLSDMETVFLPKYANAEDEFIMASHADRLKMSQCFIKSEGKIEKNSLRPYKNGLTCVICHNPHVSVKVTRKEVFNNACKSCHLSLNPSKKKTCSETQAIRNKVQNNCVSCHMPKSSAIDIPHVSITDHFIRKNVKKQDVAGIKKFIGLVAINEKNPEPKVKAEAYLNQYEKFTHDLPLLDSAKKYLQDKTIDEIKNNLSLLVRFCFLKNDYKRILYYSSRFSQHFLLTTLLNHISYSNNDAWTCYRIAQAYTNTGRINDAYLFFKKATELAPYNLDFQDKLGVNLVSQNKTEDAIKIYEKIISEDPKDASAYSNLGFIYFIKHDFTSAEINYDKSLALDPDFKTALMNKIQLYVTQNKNSQATSILNQMLRKNPHDQRLLSIKQKLGNKI